MICKVIFIVVFLPVIVAMLSFDNLSFSKKNLDKKSKVGNHPPVVKIISPKNNSAYGLNSMVSYEIRVLDKEDGESKYGEINPKEIFLKIKYVKDTNNIIAETRSRIGNDTPALATIKNSNCMNCHSFKTKLIGPSFNEITRRYAGLDYIQDTLAEHILKGSKGRWGDVPMPSNNQLNSSQALEVIRWLFNNAADSATDYIAGSEGSFRLSPPATCKNVLLVATYTDHGSEGGPMVKGLKGEDVILIHIK